MAAQQGKFDGELWFFTYDHTAKTDEITKDKHVNVTFVDPSDNRYVWLSGMASVVRTGEGGRPVTRWPRRGFPRD